MPNIRWRIGLSVFLLVAALQIALSTYVLARVQESQLAGIDDDLFEELVEMAALASIPELAAYADAETRQNTKWDEDFFEVVDAATGARLVASANVPAEGFGEPVDSAVLEPRWGRPLPLRDVRVWELTHPGSRKRHTRLRLASVVVNGRRIVTAESMKVVQKSYWALREQLSWGLVVVALLGSAGAWWVARRSLAPIHAITERARRLGAAAVGSLPRTGNQDELDRLAEVLNEMLERIRAEVQRVQRVGADAAHALRTPLAAIRGTLEVHMQLSGPEQVLSLAPALEVVDETIALVNQLLLLARLESNPHPLAELQLLRLDVMARDVVEALAVVAEDREIALAAQVDPAEVRGDAHQLRNALVNLIDNALRHTPAGGRIQVSVRSAGPCAELAIEDTGRGLRPDQLERVFERFYSDQDGQVGSGLGLAIARAVAEAHGGTLTASSPAGARFELRLPLAPATPPRVT